MKPGPYIMQRKKNRKRKSNCRTLFAFVERGHGIELHISSKYMCTNEIRTNFYANLIFHINTRKKSEKRGERRRKGALAVGVFLSGDFKGEWITSNVELFIFE